jgi:hypothetical protein
MRLDLQRDQYSWTRLKLRGLATAVIPAQAGIQ